MPFGKMSSPYQHIRSTNFDNGHHSTHLEHLCNLNVRDVPAKHRKTGIICTIGPACNDVEKLRSMIQHGMNIARLNFSHGTHEEHAKVIEMVREAAKDHIDPVAIALDTKGPEIRTGLLVDGEVILEPGKSILLSTDPSLEKTGTATSLYVDYANLTKFVWKVTSILRCSYCFS
ncbi:unnamed protein product [Heligmosomoides polygyrus]|uniref:pyruvate kinase n=1 Tax=Heligmosomoides polygyrus TaxID=6339 RepID=A0A183GV07_HELPZ|nr:unnamed protein product [Heligmosomoides polygyrus]